MAELERGFLGLTHNPFVQPDRGFFEQADRKSHLEQLRHLSQWSRRVLLVTGPEGIGKSTLYRQLSASLEPRCKAARIHASLINTTREVLVSVAQGFGIAVPANANIALLTDMLRNHVDEQTAAERICVVMVDDADQLEPKAVVDLMTLAANCSLQLVLFGDMKLVPAIERVAGRLGLGWHEIRLNGFSEAQTREYLEWRFQQARYRGRLPFTESQVKEIQHQSEGMPGRINQLANVLLDKLESGDIGRDTAAFPAVHKALLVLLTVVVGLLYLLWQQSEDTAKREALVVESLPASADEPADEPEDGAEIAAALTDETDIVVPRELESERMQQAAGVAETRKRQEFAGTGTEAAEAESASAGESVESIAPAEPAAAPASSADSETLPVPASETANTALQKPDPVAVEPTVAVAAQPEPRREPQAEVEKSEPAAQPATPEESAPSAAVQPVVGAADEVEDNGEWLLAQDPNAFTLQLVTVSSAERAQAFVDAQPDPRDFAIYRLQRDGRVLHVIVYGIFGTRSEAEAASRSLPASVGKVNPWIRTLEQVHGAIRTMPP